MSEARAFIYTIPQFVLEDTTLSGTDLRVYMYVRSFMDTTKEAYFSNDWAAKKLNVDPLTISRSISKLVKKSYIHSVIDTKASKRYLSICNPRVDEKIKDDIHKDQPPLDEKINQLDQRSITSKDINIVSKNEIEKLFDEMWNRYPLKKSKQMAFKAFTKLLANKGRPAAENLAKEIWRGLNACIQEHNTKNQLKEQGADIWVPNLPHLSTWLNNARWEDNYQQPCDILSGAQPTKGIVDITKVFGR